MSADDTGKELTLPGEPVAPEGVPVHGIGAALNPSAARPSHVDSFSTLPSFHDAEFHCLAFSYAPLDLLQVVPIDHCLVNEDIFPGVITIDESIPVLLVNI